MSLTSQQNAVNNKNMKLIYFIINIGCFSIGCLNAEEQKKEYEYLNEKYEIIYDELDKPTSQSSGLSPEDKNDKRYRVLNLNFLKGDLVIINGKVLWNRIFYGNINEIKELRYQKGNFYKNVNSDGVKLDFKTFLFPALTHECNGTLFELVDPLCSGKFYTEGAEQNDKIKFVIGDVTVRYQHGHCYILGETYKIPHGSKVTIEGNKVTWEKLNKSK